jgi:hypothetical protein
MKLVTGGKYSGPEYSRMKWKSQNQSIQNKFVKILAFFFKECSFFSRNQNSTKLKIGSNSQVEGYLNDQHSIFEPIMPFWHIFYFKNWT